MEKKVADFLMPETQEPIMVNMLIIYSSYFVRTLGIYFYPSYKHAAFSVAQAPSFTLLVHAY